MSKILKFTFQLAGFTIVGLLFFVWYLGYRKNNPSLFSASPNQKELLLGNTDTNFEEDTKMYSSSDYSGPLYSKPPRVANQKLGYGSNTAGEPIAEATATASPNRLKSVRKWEGVHRDGPFAANSVERFGKIVAELSEEHGLYPDVFMARIIAYSYDFVLSPSQDPYDKNFPALKTPDGTGRARFKNAYESLKAYAIINAGEITRLSKEGAIAKHDRSWTIQKIIANYDAVAALVDEVPTLLHYAGEIGTANNLSEAEVYENEVVGETIKMATNVDNRVKEQQANTAGFDNWEEYMEDLPREQQIKKTEEAKDIATAVSKKKAIHLKRRVAAKKNKPSTK